jgi:F0F1-type ATP synthase membrane subunit b/b'
MNNLPYTIATYLGIGSLFFAVCGLFYLLYLHIQEEKEREKRKQRVDQDVSKVIKDAQGRAEAMIAQANQEAQKIIGDAQYVKSNASHLFDETLLKVENTMIDRFTHNADEFDKQYTEAFTRLKQEYAKKADQTFSSVEQLTREEFDKKMNEEFENVKQQLEAYKQNQLKRVNEQINKIIVQVVREVLGRSITTTDHEQLILESLEQAKKEGVFAS